LTVGIPAAVSSVRRHATPTKVRIVAPVSFRRYDDPSVDGSRLETAVPTIPVLVRRLLPLVWWPALAAPPVVTVALVLGMGDVKGETPGWNKDVFEVVAMVTLWAGIGVAAARFAWQRSPFFLWAMAILAVLLFREYHLLKQSTAISIVALVVLGIVGWRTFPRLGVYLETRTVVTLLTLMALTYLLTSILDWDRFKYDDYVYTVTEEVVECGGHAAGLLMVLLARRRREGPDRSSRSP
jgi:hypothetical protein